MSEALDIYLDELKITKFFGKSSGFDVFTEIFPYTFMTFYTVFYASVYHFGQLYSIYYFRNDFVNLCFCLVCWAYGLQGVSFLQSFHSNRATFWKMHLTFVDIYKRFSNNDVMLEYTKKIRLMTRVICVCLTANIICSLVYPYLNAIFIAKKKVLGFGFLLPFTDPKTDFGFYINFIFQQHCWVFTGLGYVGVFRVVWLISGQIIIKTEILKFMIESLKELVDANVDGKTKNNKKISLKLKEIIDFHIIYLQHIEDFETIANKFFFVLASTTTFQVSITLLVLTLENWYPGYFIIFVSTFQLMIICAAGTYAESQHESLTDALYDIPWYLMSIKHQKMFLYILMSSQKEKPLTFGELSNINVETFVEIYKRIYSGFMLLTNTE